MTVRTPPTRAATPPAATRALVGTLALLSVAVPLGTDMYLPALPAMARDLAASDTAAQATLATFLAGLALGQLVLGPVSDRYGRRRPMLVGTACCALAGAACALAPSVEVLAAARFAMGFAGAAGVVVGRAVVVDLLTGAAAQRTFAVLMALGGLAPIVAPVLGGAVAGGAGRWRLVFWVLTGILALMVVATALAVPESLPAERRRSDLGATVRAAGRVLGDRVYLGYALAFAATCGALFCYIAGSPFLYQQVLGFGVRPAAALFSAGALVATLSSAAAARLVRRVPAALLLRAGLAVLLGAAVAGALAASAGRLGRIGALGLIALAFVGLGQVFGTGTGLAMARVPGAAGAGSALLGTMQSVFGALAAPLLGVLGTGVAVSVFAGMAGCTAVAGIAVLLTVRPGPVAAPDGAGSGG